MAKAWLHQKDAEKIIFPSFYNCETCSCKGSDSALKGHCWWTEITAELPNHCPGHHRHSLVKVAPEERMEVLRGSMARGKHSGTLLTPNKESKLPAITVVSHLQMLLSLLGLWLNGAIETLGNKIYLTQNYTASSLQKYHRSWNAQEYFNVNPYSVFAA